MSADLIHDLTARVRGYTLKHEMLDPEDDVVVLFSGGPDSTVLLHVLTRLQREFGLELTALHLNHGLRPEADAEQDAAEKACSELGVKFVCRRIDVDALAMERGMGLEEAGRYGRYVAAREQGADKIAVGHTADDSVEWSLMNFVRGSSLRGLTGIPPTDHEGVIRPLLATSKSDILAYLHAGGISYSLDAGNLEARFLRSKVRTQLMPAVRAVNPSFGRSVRRTAELLRLDADLLAESYKGVRDRLRIDSDGGRVVLDRALMADIHPALQARAIHDAASEISPSGARISAAPILSCLELLRRGGSGSEIVLAQGVRICLDADAVVISAASPGAIVEQQLHASGRTELPGIGTIEFSERPRSSCFPKDGATAVLDAEAVELPLRVRCWRHGDWFIPLGMKGRKKLQDFFVDAKVPGRLRMSVPVVEDREKIVWVAGYRIDDRARVVENTDKVLVLEYVRAGSGKG